jgi:hypothetical protein
MECTAEEEGKSSMTQGLASGIWYPNKGISSEYFHFFHLLFFGWLPSQAALLVPLTPGSLSGIVMFLSPTHFHIISGNHSNCINLGQTPIPATICKDWRDTIRRTGRVRDMYSSPGDGYSHTYTR